MPRTPKTTNAERAESDIVIDLGDGYSTTYHEGDVIAPQHRGLPTRAANLPPTTEQPDDVEARGDLAPDRIIGADVVK